jgi:hypothetical protein
MNFASQRLLGSARVSRAGFGALAKTIFAFFHPTEMKVRDGSGAIASRRGVRSDQMRHHSVMSTSLRGN